MLVSCAVPAAAAAKSFHELFSETFVDARPKATTEQTIQEPRAPLFPLGVSERVQAKEAHAASERVRELRQQENVGRTGQDETTRSSILIDGDLERTEEMRNMLDLIENRLRRQPGYKTNRVVLRNPPDVVVVERNVAVAPRLPHHPGQRGLAALPRTMDEHRRRVRDRLTQARNEIPRNWLGAGHGRWAWALQKLSLRSD